MNDYQGYRFPKLIQIRKISDNATSFTIVTDKVPTGHMWVVERLDLVSETDTTNNVTVSITGLGTPHQIFYQAVAAANVVYNVNRAFFVPEGCAVTLTWALVTLTNVVAAYFTIFDVIQPEGARHD